VPSNVLVVNAGSKSVKLRLVGPDDKVTASSDLGTPDDTLADHLADFIGSRRHEIDVVGHRVVHGGAQFSGPVVVDPAIRAALGELNDLAPLHNPPALAGIDAAMALLPLVPSIACFDTAFHAGLAPEAFTYALPHEWATRWGIRRYGFHGLNCQWVAQRTPCLLGRPLDGVRLVICHLGGGASVTAVLDGMSVDTTMGFTPLEGLVMATRSGDVDPGALLWIQRKGVPADEVDDALEHRAGLLGLSGGSSSDMRVLLTARDGGHQRATLAVSVYLHRLRAKIAAMAAAAGGLDVLAFTGGIGEHAAAIRTEAAAGLGWLGVALDDDANANVGDADTDISAGTATVRTLVVHAREDLQIAADCRRLSS
jgi:acetate kinase